MEICSQCDHIRVSYRILCLGGGGGGGSPPPTPDKTLPMVYRHIRDAMYSVVLSGISLQELCGSLEELCDSHYGRRVLLYLLEPRSPRHFSPQFIDILTPGDGNKYR